MRQAGRDVICNRFKVPARLFVGHFRALHFGNEHGPDDRLFAHKFTSPGSARLDAMTKTAAAHEAITPAEYRAFQDAYDFFNAELFAGSLPHVLVTLQRHANTRGYFAPERFTGRMEKAAAHELAMNPDTFTGRSDEDILSTLAHEMAHAFWPQSGHVNFVLLAFFAFACCPAGADCQ